jgi:beta-lactam-binding protein with PASTA domain
MTSGMNELRLTATFTHRADPIFTVVTPPTTGTTTTTTVTPPAVKCVVPRLTGLKLAKARRAAAKANCAVGKVKRKQSARRSSTVLKQGAKRGTVLAQGTRIALTVAR